MEQQTLRHNLVLCQLHQTSECVLSQLNPHLALEVKLITEFSVSYFNYFYPWPEKLPPNFSRLLVSLQPVRLIYAAEEKGGYLAIVSKPGAGERERDGDIFHL